MSDLVRYLRASKGWPTLGNAAADRIEELEAEVARLREALEWSLDSLKFAQAELKAQAHIPAGDAKMLQRRIDFVRDVLIQASAQEGEE